MLRVSELLQVFALKKALKIPLDEGSCFGVQDPKELRPKWQSHPKAPTTKKGGAKMTKEDSCQH